MRQKLLNNGYLKFQAGKLNNADTLYQKRIRVDDITRYFINVYEYDFSQFRNYPKDQEPLRYSADATFYCDNDRTFEVKLSIESNDGIEYIESFFASIYKKMECIPDRYNQ